jgi:hypothetical protein
MAKAHLKLQQTEGYVIQAAAQIYAAQLASGRVDEGQEAECMENAIRDAIRIAKTVDAAIVAEGEMEH